MNTPILHPTNTLTFLFTDIEGSTKLWEQYPEAMAVALAQHDTLLRQLIERHNGSVFKTVGDAFYAVFTVPIEALLTALAIQQALLTTSWPASLPPLKVRMALHTGLVEERDGDYFGPPLNRVARLLAAGHGGQILLSLAVQALVRDLLPPLVHLRDMGERHLKDLIRPEQVFQVVAPDLPQKFPPLKTLDARPHNLPAQTTLFVGRVAALTAVKTLLLRPDVRLLTLTGPGGTGKTRLSLQTAVDLIDDFEDGVFFIPLEAVRTPDLLATAVAQTLAINDESPISPLEKVKRFLQPKKILLVLDNFEQIVDAAPQISELLSHAPGLKVMVSSRILLRVYGEQEYPVPPLALPDLTHLPSLAPLSQYEAVHLFIERAQAAKADFVMTNENAPAVAEICCRLDGLPLAIELAAVRVRLLPPQKLLAQLSHRLKLLTGGARNLPARQQTLRGAIDWSYNLLTEPQKRVFRRLGVFRGGCTLSAVEAICNPEGDADIWGHLESLLDQSLINQAEVNEETRFTMLETIHEYALEMLAEAGEENEIRRQHLAYFGEMAQTAVPLLRGEEQAVGMAQLLSDVGNLRRALDWAFNQAHQPEDRQMGLRLAATLWFFWLVRSEQREGQMWLEKAAQITTPETPATLQAELFSGLGTMLWALGQYEQSGVWHQQALAQYRALNDKKGMAFALNNIGVQVGKYQNREASLSYYEASLALARELNNTTMIFYGLCNMGTFYMELGLLMEAKVAFDELVRLEKKLSDPYMRCIIFLNTGDLYRKFRDFSRASALYEQAIEVATKADYLHIVAEVERSQGLNALVQGAWGTAVTLFQHSLEKAHTHHSQRGRMFNLQGMAMAMALSNSPQAGQVAQFLGAAEGIRQGMNSQEPVEEPDLYAQTLAWGASVLSPAEWAQAWEKGHALTLAEVIQLAQQVTMS